MGPVLYSSMGKVYLRWGCGKEISSTFLGCNCSFMPWLHYTGTALAMPTFNLKTWLSNNNLWFYMKCNFLSMVKQYPITRYCLKPMCVQLILLVSGAVGIDEITFGVELQKLKPPTQRPEVTTSKQSCDFYPHLSFESLYCLYCALKRALNGRPCERILGNN